MIAKGGWGGGGGGGEQFTEKIVLITSMLDAYLMPGRYASYLIGDSDSSVVRAPDS